ncbi:MAG: MoaD/ThiS family protein [Pirellulaceae bacterium]
MPTVWIPAPCRDLSQGAATVEVAGSTVREAVEALENVCPGIKARLIQGDAVRPGTQVVVDGQVARLGMRQPVASASEIHFLPAIGGG